MTSSIQIWVLEFSTPLLLGRKLVIILNQHGWKNSVFFPLFFALQSQPWDLSSFFKGLITILTYFSYAPYSKSSFWVFIAFLDFYRAFVFVNTSKREKNGWYYSILVATHTSLGVCRIIPRKMWKGALNLLWWEKLLPAQQGISKQNPYWSKAWVPWCLLYNNIDYLLSIEPASHFHGDSGRKSMV